MVWSRRPNDKLQNAPKKLYICVCKPTSTELAGKPKIMLGKRYKSWFKNFGDK